MARSRLPLSPAALASVIQAQLSAARDTRPLVVAGARELAAALRRELVADGDWTAVVEGGTFQGASALVYVLAGTATEVDELELKAARRSRVPLVVVQTDPDAEAGAGSVLPTELVVVERGTGFPIDRIVSLLAYRLGDRGPALAARLPVLRGAVCDELIARVARQNAVIGGAAFLPGADLPALTVNQLRLVLQIGQAHGFPLTPRRVPEGVGVMLGGLGLRRLARSLLLRVPLRGWVVKGGVAFVGTRALGEAAVRYYESKLAESIG